MKFRKAFICFTQNIRRKLSSEGPIFQQAVTIINDFFPVSVNQHSIQVCFPLLEDQIDYFIISEFLKCRFRV